MKCPHCGKKISDYSVTCPNCGGDPKKEASADVRDRVQNIIGKADRRNANILIVIAFAVTAVTGYYFISGFVSCIVFVAAIIFGIVAFIVGQCYKTFTKRAWIISVVISVIEAWILLMSYNKFVQQYELVVALGVGTCTAWILKIIDCFVAIVLGVSLVQRKAKKKRVIGNEQTKCDRL